MTCLAGEHIKFLAKNDKKQKIAAFFFDLKFIQWILVIKSSQNFIRILLTSPGFGCLLLRFLKNITGKFEGLGGPITPISKTLKRTENSLSFF